MMIKTGITRIVFVLETRVVKIPNFFYSWQSFLRGILANISEGQTWRWNSGKYERGKSHLLCPVILTSWGGWILIMRKAETAIFYEDGREFDFSKHIAEFPGDDKPSNYGFLEGRLVKIDYGQLG
jgi:hypothetical protein